MSKQKLSVYALAGVVRDEAFLESQLQIAGSNQSRILENINKKKNTIKHNNTIKRQALVVKVVYALLIAMQSILPLVMYFQVIAIISGVPAVDSIYIVSISLLSLCFAMTLLYMIILGIMSLSGFMAGEVFQWLEVLPIPRKTLQKVGFTVLWRFFDIPLIVQIAVFPILITWASGNALVFFACVATSLLNTLFAFCLLILLTEKFSRIIKGGGGNSTKASILRTLTMLGYVIAVTSTSLVLNLGIQSIGTLITSALTVENPALINVILSLIPFPFAPAYLVTLLLIPTSTIPLQLVFSTIVGIFLLVLLIRRMYRSVLNKLRNLTSHQARIALLADQKSPSQMVIRPIQPVPPTKAFIRKDLTALLRDLSGSMYLLMPLVFPFVMFLPASFSGPESSLSWTGGGVGLYGYLFIYLIMLTAMDAGMLVSGILGIEDAGASIMASLPVVPRDQAKAKMKLIGILALVSHLLPLVIHVGATEFIQLIPYFLCYSLVGIAIVFLTMAMKVRLFGKTRFKYVVEEVNVERKTLKWVAIYSLNFLLLLGVLFLMIFVGETLTAQGILLLFVVAGAGGLLAVFWWLHRMFPKLSSRSQTEIPHK